MGRPGFSHLGVPALAFAFLASVFGSTPLGAHNFDRVPHPDPRLASGVEKNAVLAFCPQIARDGKHSSYLGRYGLVRNDDSSSGWEYTSEPFMGSTINVRSDPDSRSCTVEISRAVIPFNPTSTRRILEGNMRVEGYEMVDGTSPTRVFQKVSETGSERFVYRLKEGSDTLTVTFTIESN